MAVPGVTCDRNWKPVRVKCFRFEWVMLVVVFVVCVLFFVTCV